MVPPIRLYNIILTHADSILNCSVVYIYDFFFFFFIISNDHSGVNLIFQTKYILGGNIIYNIIKLKYNDNNIFYNNSPNPLKQSVDLSNETP